MTDLCLHCGSKNPDSSSNFCCNGCSAAYAIIKDSGLGDYYQKRIIKAEEKVLKPEFDLPIQFEEFVTSNQFSDPNHHLAYFLVEGLHCAACVWLIENILKKQAVVVKARINISTRRLYLEWLGQVSEVNNFAKLVTSLGYNLVPFDIEILKSEEQKYDNSLLKALSVAGFAAGNLMLISVALWSSDIESMGVATRSLFYWLSALIALPAIIYSGRIFFVSAWKAVKSRRSNMDVPISIAIILASSVSFYETLIKAQHIYFDSALMLVFFLLIGRYLDFSARRKALAITGDLILLQGSSATIIENNGQLRIIPVKEIKKDMILLVRCGEKITADGLIIEGESEIDTSIITGEFLPKKAKSGEQVFAGMINLSAPIKVQVNSAKDQTLLAKIIEMILDIEQQKSRYVQIADKIAKYYTPAVHILALIGFLLWFFYFAAGFHKSLLIATAVLIITCPCALALAVPTVQTVANSWLMKRGILLKSGEALEKINKIKVIIFDKTGTLTTGKIKLVSASLLDDGKPINIDQDHDYFQLAAFLASKTNHPLAKALAVFYQGKNFALKQVKEIAGYGLEALYLDRPIKLGKREFVDCQISDGGSFNPEIFFAYEDKILHFIFEDDLRVDAFEVIASLKQMGKKIILLSGDKEIVVSSIAQKLVIDEYYHSKTPIEKCQKINSFKERYLRILMVGDGLNDAPALAMADVSISPSKAADITKNIADIIFQGDRLEPILQIVKLADKSVSLMKQNFILSLTYNLIAIPFALAGFVIPLVAALAMSSSSILVVLNALRIKKIK